MKDPEQPFNLTFHMVLHISLPTMGARACTKVPQHLLGSFQGAKKPSPGSRMYYIRMGRGQRSLSLWFKEKRNGRNMMLFSEYLLCLQMPLAETGCLPRCWSAWLQGSPLAWPIAALTHTSPNPSSKSHSPGLPSAFLLAPSYCY